jgi:Predicted redox protein, regulator of disulfide bond formation
MKSRSELITPGFKSVIDNGRNHTITADLPPSQGGTDVAATALELMVMSLSGCITTIFAVVAQNSNVSFERITVDLDAEKGKETIEKVHADVTVISCETEERVKRILEKTMKTCPVGILFEKAGISLSFTLKCQKN